MTEGIKIYKTQDLVLQVKQNYVETKACVNCIAFDKLLRFDEISYRWYRCDKCIHNQIGKRYNK
ncbi:MAG TPA: hypothetical protein PLM44_03125 [bacterium]|nr:hypothetical protein [bacterium]